MQAVLKYHFSFDSVNTQKVSPPNTNNKTGNAMFIFSSSTLYTKHPQQLYKKVFAVVKGIQSFIICQAH